MFKAVTDVYVICTFTDMNTNACDEKKLMLQICLSYLDSSLWISICFHDMYFTLANMFQLGVFQLLLMKSLFTWTHMYHI